MAEPKLQERLPLPEFHRMDDAGTLLLDGLKRYRAHYDPQGNWPVSTEFLVQTSPQTEVPKLANEIAELAPKESLLSDSVQVRQLFNALSFASPVGHKLAFIPYVEVSGLDNRGEL